MIWQICFLLTKMLAILFGPEEVKQLEVSQIETQNYQKRNPETSSNHPKKLWKTKVVATQSVFLVYHEPWSFMIQFDFRIFFRWVEDPRLGCALGRQVGEFFWLFFLSTKKNGRNLPEKKVVQKGNSKSCKQHLFWGALDVFWRIYVENIS